MPYVLPGNRKVSPDQSFVLNDIQYPPNWLRHATQADKDALGITWENDPAPSAPPPPTVDQLLAYAAQKRWTIQTAGKDLGNGVIVDTSTNSLTMITGAIESLERGWTSEPLNFKAKSGWVVLTLAQLQASAAAVTQHVQACFNAEKAVATAITATPPTITNYQHIEEYAWPT